MPVRAVERKLTAILAADVAGYSRLMGADEVGTLQRLTACRAIVDGLISSHRGRIFNTAGDSVGADFASAVDAVECAVAVQEALVDENANQPAAKQMQFRIGVHIGDVIVQGDNLLGDGVNITARLEALAEPGGICVSGAVHDQIGTKLPVSFVELADPQMKNIARPVRAYAMRATAAASPALVEVPAHPTTAGRRTIPWRVVIAASLVAMIGIGLGAWWVWPGAGSLPANTQTSPGAASTTTKTAPRLSIVVLPFANLSSDSQQDYFVDAVTDDLTTDLSRIVNSFVIARTTAFTYKGKAVDAKQIGTELGIRYVLEGSVQRLGEQIQVNVQLIDSETGAHIWADRFETDRQNLAEAQNDITGRLAQTLHLELVSDIGRRIELERAANPDARDLIMRGWASWYRPASSANREEAQRAFERALEIDPGSIDARIGIALVLARNIDDGFSTSIQEDANRAEKLLLEAFEKDPNRSMGHAAMGALRRAEDRLAEARAELETAIALDRNNAYAFFLTGSVLMRGGQPEPCIATSRKR